MVIVATKVERNKKIVPKSWEQEGHKKSNPNTWKPEVDDENPFPNFGNGNERLSLPGMARNENSRPPLHRQWCWCLVNEK